MKLISRKYTAIFAALLALCGQGCSKAPAAEDTLVQLTAPTVAPIVTPVPTPAATPTPVPTQRPAETEKPTTTEKPREEEKAAPTPTEKPTSSAKTPYADSYTPAELKSYNVKVSDFSAEAHDGSTITQEYFANGTITLLNIWSTT